MMTADTHWASRHLDCGVDKLNLPFYYHLGALLHPLTLASVPTTPKVQLWIATFNLAPLIEGALLTHGVAISQAAGRELIDAVNQTSGWSFGENANSYTDLEAVQGRNLISRALQFETILSAELVQVSAYIVSRKAIYSTSDLIERAEDMFPTSIRERLPGEVINEIREGGRCLAFNNSTASGFHAMRATEVVIHAYYLAVCKPSNKKRLDNWGEYIAQLRATNDKTCLEVIALLQQLKDDHRNLIMHPEVVLTLDDALTLFDIARTAIEAMTPRIAKPRRSRS